MIKTTKRLMMGSGCLLGLFGVLGLSGIASALTYQEEIPVSFTFNRGLSISVSASDLHIYNLTPGTSDDSNIITVTTTTNNVTGYVLTASVGNSTHTNPSFNNTNLNHTNGSTFTTVATDASLSSLTTDNTWGYSISTNNGSTWSNYSGLPLYTATNWKELANINTNGTTSIQFKIGAKASSAQPAGDYTNVINFTAVGNMVPVTIADLTYMQDFGSLTTAEINNVLTSMTQNTQYTLKDSRDQQDYTIAKLSDGNVWMTKNLNLAGGTTVTPADTNVTAEYTLPASSMECLESPTVHSCVYNTDSTVCSSNSLCYSYYSSGVATNICPKGWRLPVSSDFTALTSIYNTAAALVANPFKGVYAGYYSGGLHQSFYGVGTMGCYWASDKAHGYYNSLVFNNAGSVGVYDDYDSEGSSVRCIMDQG